jgi:hypothetical protein
MTRVKVENLVVVKDSENVDVSFLWHLLWFTISDVKISREQLEQIFTDIGIPEKYLPNPISPRDAFRRATKMIEFKREPKEGEQQTYTNILVREVSSNRERIIRQIVREVVDSKNVTLSYDPIAQLTLRNETLEARYLTHSSNITDYEIDIIDSIPDLYENAKENYNGKNVRDIIKNILYECNPVSVRPSGGVYFVPYKYTDTVENLKTFARELANFSITETRTQMFSVPVIDTQEQRDMVEDSLENQVISGSISLINEMKELVSQGNRRITQYLAEQYIDKVKALKNLVTEYEDMLESQAIKARENLNLAMAQAMKLLEEVEA